MKETLQISIIQKKKKKIKLRYKNKKKEIYIYKLRQKNFASILYLMIQWIFFKKRKCLYEKKDSNDYISYLNVNSFLLARKSNRYLSYNYLKTLHLHY